MSGWMPEAPSLDQLLGHEALGPGKATARMWTLLLADKHTARLLAVKVLSLLSLLGDA